MSTRIEMNTASLQRHFPEVYKEFFSKNDLVVSGCFTFAWSPLWGKHASRYVRTKSKLPLKCYVGIKKRKDSEIVFKDVAFYDIVGKEFESTPFIQINKEEGVTKQTIRKFLDKQGFSEGLEISILSETTRGHSFGFSGTSFAILSAGIHVLLKKIPSSQMGDGEIFFEGKIKEGVFQFAWNLEMVGRYGNTTGQNVLNTLSNTKQPSLLLMEDLAETEPKDLSEIRYKHTSLHEHFPSTKLNEDILLDYAIVYSGLSTNTRQVEQVKKVSEKMFEEYKDFIGDDLLIDETDRDQYYVGKFLKTESLFSLFSDVVCILNLKTIQLFKELYENGFDSKSVERFIGHINEYRFMGNILGEKSDFAEDFIYHFRKNQKSPEEQLGIMPVYSGKLGGGYVIVTKLGKSRDTIQKTINELQGSYANVELEYASYLDGESSDGVRIEQHLSGNIFSPHIQRDKCLYIDNRGVSYAALYREIMEKETDSVLLDTIEKKIYYNGQKLTSKDIPSQNATLDVINLLFDRLNEDVPNDEFPSSGYSKNKNEMLGKVILPFVRFIEEKTGHPFPLTCKGGLLDFCLRLEKTPVKIGIIRQLW